MRSAQTVQYDPPMCSTHGWRSCCYWILKLFPQKTRDYNWKAQDLITLIWISSYVLSPLKYLSEALCGPPTSTHVYWRLLYVIVTLSNGYRYIHLIIFTAWRLLQQGIEWKCLPNSMERKYNVQKWLNIFEIMRIKKLRWRFFSDLLNGVHKSNDLVYRKVKWCEQLVDRIFKLLMTSLPKWDHITTVPNMCWYYPTYTNEKNQHEVRS